MMPKSAITLLVLMLGGGLIVFFSSNMFEEKSDIPFRMYETQIVPDIYHSNETQLRWLDENTLIFKGFPTPGPQTDEELKTAPVSLYVWKLGEEPRKHQVDERWDGSFCVSGKGLRYRLSQKKFGDDKIYAEFIEGYPSQEHHITQELHPRKPGAPVSCQSDLYRDCGLICRNTLEGREWGPLIDNTGFIDFGYKNQSKDTVAPLTVHFDNSSDVVNTAPIPLREISELEWHYIPFLNAYFSWEFTTASVGVQARWKSTNCMPLWWIWTDGRSQRVCVPAGPWIGLTSFSPLKRGIFFHSYNSGVQGGYILFDGLVHKVMNGVVMDNHTPSPDGCKVAFIHTKDVYGKFPSVKVLDFCLTGITVTVH